LLFATYRQDRDLIKVGAYRRGSDPRIDLAIDYWPRILEFLKRDMYEPVGFARSYQDLVALAGPK
jgi:flagellum-specific ATP synthase